MDKMDRVLEQKKGLKKKHIPYLAGGVALLAIGGWLIFGDHTASLKVDSKLVTVEDVSKGEFNDYIRVNGIVEPIMKVQVSPLEGGNVEERVIEEGTMVSKGDVILRLSNPTLMMSILTSEANLAEQENNLRNTLVNMEQQRLDLQQQRLSFDMQVTQDRRKYQQYGALYREKLVSKEEYLIAKEKYELTVKQAQLNSERQIQDSIFRTIQVANMEISLESMRMNMDLTRQRVDNLDVKASISGELGLLDAVLGQYIGAGAKVGEINDLSNYKIEAMVDEHYIDRVKSGLSGTFERQDEEFNIEVRNVFPEVRNGQFRTWSYLKGSRPENIRAGQTYSLNLELGQPTSGTIMIPRGAFYQTTGGNWIFVVSPDGDRAYRRSIKINRQNAQYYEVTDGLKEGEQVITSSYETYGDNEVLVLN